MVEERINESVHFNYRLAKLSKALWKAVEKDWLDWIKTYDLNINEHHILLIADQKDGASISDIAKFGVMHVSTAFNFSKKLEKRRLILFYKKNDDKRNTYVKLTSQGVDLLKTIASSYAPEENSVFKAALPIYELYGKFPEMHEMVSIVRNIYGEEFMEILNETPLTEKML